MIDWDSSEHNINDIKNKCIVIVVCESCNNKREQLYQVAKRKSTHICMSCVKSSNKHGSMRTGQLVTYRCSCGAEKEMKYRPSRYEKWQCHHCAMVGAHKEGKIRSVHNTPSIEGRERLSELARQRWADPEYRLSMATKKALSKARRSDISKQLWKDEDRLRALSESIKRVWLQDEYRNTRSRQSRECWKSEGYRIRHANGMLRDDARQRMLAARGAQKGAVSNIQRMLYSFLHDLNVDFYEEGDKTRLGYYSFDCLIPAKSGGKGGLLECQGDYWHTLSKTQVKDRSKFSYISRYFPEYEIMYIWEHEFYAKDKVIGRLKSKLGIEVKVEDFDLKDLVIVEDIKVADINSFLDAYHYIGKGRSGKTFGAYINDKLIACAVYSNLIRQNIAHQFDGDSLELARLCIHPNYQKRNLASYFLSRTFKNLNVTNVISYCDTTVGHTGAVYKSLGFMLHHEVDPDYWYIDTNGWVMHKKTLYERARKMGTTEADYASQFGYIRKYGGRKYCFLKKLN